MKFRFQKTFLGFVLVSFLLLTGCQETDLHSNLQELEADEILVLLNQYHLTAKKEKVKEGQEISWKVSIKSDDLAQARQILVANHLPRKRELGLSGVFKDKNSLIPTPEEQQALYLLALKGEIINLIRSINGVVNVDVVLNVPKKDEFDELRAQQKRPTASIVVKTINDDFVSQTVSENKVQRMVASAVPSLDPNDVTVIISRIDEGGSVRANVPMPNLLAGVPPIVASQTVPDSVVTPPTSLVNTADPVATASTPDDVYIEDPRALPVAVTPTQGSQPVAAPQDQTKWAIAVALLLLMSASGFVVYRVLRRNKAQQPKAVPMNGGQLGGGPSTGYLGDGQSQGNWNQSEDIGSQQKRF